MTRITKDHHLRTAAKVALTCLLAIILSFTGLFIAPGSNNLAAAQDDNSEDIEPRVATSVTIGEYRYLLEDSDLTATLAGYTGTAASLYMGTNFGRTVDYGGKTYTITAIDIRDINTRVKTLQATYNANLISIKVGGFTALTGLTCNNNANLNTVNVASNAQLESLRCNDSKLTSLSVSAGTRLATLYCQNNMLLDLKGNVTNASTWNGSMQAVPAITLAFDEASGKYVSETGMLQAGHAFTYNGTEPVVYNTSTDRFEIAASAVSASSFSGPFTTLVASGKPLVGTISFATSGSQITAINAHPSSLGASGGASTVTIEGRDLPEGLRVGFTTDQNIDPAASSVVTANGSGSQAEAVLTFPATNNGQDITYFIRVSYDGLTWYRVDDTCTVTVAGQYDPDAPAGSIGFNGKRWLNIGKNGTGVASDPGTTTLLLADGYRYDVSSRGSQTYNTVQFNPVANFSPTYNNSYLHQEMQAIKESIGDSLCEYNSIEPRVLYGSTNFGDLDKHYGATMVSFVWPLSTSEATALTGSTAPDDYRSFIMGPSNGVERDGAHDNAFIYQGLWWLRTAQSQSSIWNVVFDGRIEWYYLHMSMAVRPALQLDLGSILMSSASVNSAGKGQLALGEVAQLGDIQGTDAVKYTLIDRSGTYDSFSTSTSHVTANVGQEVSIPFSGAHSDSNDYVSALITAQDGTTPFAYIKMANATASGKATFTLPDSIQPGTYTISLFNEQITADDHSDVTSPAIAITLEVNERPASLVVLLGLDRPFTQEQSFLISVQNQDTLAQCTKLLTVSPNQTTAQFTLYLDPGTYVVRGIEEGSTWRYFFAAGHEVDVDPGTKSQAYIDAMQRTNRWMSTTKNLINRMTL